MSEMDDLIASTISMAVDNIDTRKAKLAEIDSSINSFQLRINELQDSKAPIQAEIDVFRTNITSAANMAPPVQAAVDLLNVHPEYGIN